MRFRVGDILERPYGRHPIRYTVEGRTSRGKLICRRESGTILTTWWRDREHALERGSVVLIRSGDGPAV